jgi:hypothetical protein
MQPAGGPDGRGLPADEAWEADALRRPAHSTLRLQPVVLGPPPGLEGRGVSAADDLDPAELRPKGRAGRLAALAAAALVLATSGAAYVILSGRDRPAADLPPEVRPPAETLAAPTLPAPGLPAPDQAMPTPEPMRPPPAQEASPPQAPTSQAAAAAQTGAQTAQGAGAQAGVDMGNVESDLVPPSTEGLSPARRIRTIRITVENDRELPAMR